ncbi:hypothetical protein EV426DRAFT_366959 [Tirmania nivea]|nr:hypothetical protein EV426DRAFT_366959 [Tirmania nivea]
MFQCRWLCMVAADVSKTDMASSSPVFPVWTSMLTCDRWRICDQCRVGKRISKRREELEQQQQKPTQQRLAQLHQPLQNIEASNQLEEQSQDISRMSKNFTPTYSEDSSSMLSLQFSPELPSQTPYDDAGAPYNSEPTIQQSIMVLRTSSIPTFTY